MKPLRSLLLGSAACIAVSTAAFADPSVVASIKPVHSLVAGVMAGVGEPELIVDGAASPHTYSLRPSQAASLEKANVVFWIGPQIESFMDKPLETLGRNATVVNLGEAHGLELLPQREGGAFEGHDHGDHAGHDDHAEHADHDDHDDHAKHDDHDDHDDHAKHDDHDDHAEHDDHDDHAKHDDHDDHAKHDDHDDHAKHDDHAGHDDHDAHGSGFNAHVWLDPQNAKALVHEIEEALAKADPENAAQYEKNAHELEERLDALTTELSAMLEPVQDKTFVVFHDAYPYFENRFGVSAAGSITVSPEVAPGAARVTEIKDKVGDLAVACVFSEPQFEPRIVQVITEGTSANAGVLDPLGADLDNGPDLYFELLRKMGSDMRACLAGNS